MRRTGRRRRPGPLDRSIELDPGFLPPRDQGLEGLFVVRVECGTWVGHGLRVRQRNNFDPDSRTR